MHPHVAHPAVSHGLELFHDDLAHRFPLVALTAQLGQLLVIVREHPVFRLELRHDQVVEGAVLGIVHILHGGASLPCIDVVLIPALERLRHWILCFSSSKAERKARQIPAAAPMEKVTQIRIGINR